MSSISADDANIDMSIQSTSPDLLQVDELPLITSHIDESSRYELLPPIVSIPSPEVNP